MTETLTTTVEIYSQSEISAHLTRASEQVVEYLYDGDFHQRLVDAHVSLDSADSGKYWEQLAIFVSRKASAENLSPMERKSLQLAGYLPNYLHAEYVLNKNEKTLTHSEAKGAKQTASVYNGLVRDFVSEHPQSPTDLRSSLLETTMQTIGAESRDFLNFADTAIEGMLKGVKHELAFAATLDSFGLSYRTTTIQEDLKGRDLVLLLGEREIGIDVKASLTAVDAKNNGSDGSPIAIKPNGDLVVYSLFTDKDFADSFTPTQEALDLKSSAIAAYLQAAIR